MMLNSSIKFVETFNIHEFKIKQLYELLASVKLVLSDLHMTKIIVKKNNMSYDFYDMLLLEQAIINKPELKNPSEIVIFIESEDATIYCSISNWGNCYLSIESENENILFSIKNIFFSIIKKKFLSKIKYIIIGLLTLEILIFPINMILVNIFNIIIFLKFTIILPVTIFIYLLIIYFSASFSNNFHINHISDIIKLK